MSTTKAFTINNKSIDSHRQKHSQSSAKSNHQQRANIIVKRSHNHQQRAIISKEQALSSNAFTIISKEQASSCASAECAWGDECSGYLLPFEDNNKIFEVSMMVSCGRKKEGNFQSLSRQTHIRAHLDVNMAPGGGREGF